MADWTSESHNVYFAANYFPSQELKLTALVTFNNSTGGLDQVNFPDVEDRLGGYLPHMDYHFDQMHEYSNIDFTMWQLELGGDYKLTPVWRLTASLAYADLADSQPYVYGDESGSMYIVRAGARMGF